MKNVIWLCIPVLFFAACNANTNLPKQELNKRNIEGGVKLYDDMKNPQSSAGMRVSLEGTGYVTYTDTGGVYKFDVVPYGVYTIVFQKDGYGTFKEIFNHISDGNGKPAVVPLATLGKVATTTVTALTVRVDDDTIHFTATINPAGSNDSARNVRYFFDSVSAVSPTAFLGQVKSYEIKNQYGMFKLYKTDFLTMGFTAGQTVYIKAYGDAEHSNDYLDNSTGALVFPNLNTSVYADTSFVLP